MTTGNVEAIMADYQLYIDEANRIAVSAARKATASLRQLLVPILHRWGMGMKNGGTLVYANPNIEGPDEAIMPKDYDYVLGELHPELQGALWEIDTAPYEFTLHDYMDDIDLPPPNSVHYIWIARASHNDHLEIVDMTSSWGHEPSDMLYYGPLTREFVRDVGTIGADLDVEAVLGTLPKYRAGDVEWERVIEEGTTSHTPGLLKGEVGDGFNEPVSWVELLGTEPTYTLHYDTNSPPIRDVDIEATVSRLHHQDIYTSTGLVVEAALCHMMEGTLPRVRVMIEGQPMTFNDDGIVVGWAGFPTTDYSKRIMLAALVKWSREYTL